MQRNLVALELLRAAAQAPGLRVQLGVAFKGVDFEGHTLSVAAHHGWDAAADDSQRILDAWNARLPSDKASVNEASAAELRDRMGTKQSAQAAAAQSSEDAETSTQQHMQSLRYDLLVAADGAFSEVRPHCGPARTAPAECASAQIWLVVLQIRAAAIKAGHIQVFDQCEPYHKYKTFSDIQVKPDAEDLPKWLGPDVRPFELMYFATSVRRHLKSILAPCAQSTTLAELRCCASRC